MVYSLLKMGWENLGWFGVSQRSDFQVVAKLCETLDVSLEIGQPPSGLFGGRLSSYLVRWHVE